MTTTRKLDILAIIGIVLAVAAIAIPTAISWSYRVPPGQWREIALRGMPNTDVRADFELLTEWPWGKDAYQLWSSREWESAKAMDEYRKQERMHTLPVLTQAARRFPDSARIQFRLGTLGEKNQCVAALGKTADLDRTNALPLYLLAGIHATQGKYTEAIRLVAQGNQRPGVTWYPITPVDVSNDMFSESLVSSANSRAQLPYWMLTRQTVRQLSRYADRLRVSGNKAQALSVSGQLQTMCSKFLHEGMVGITDVSFASSISAMADEPVRLVYQETGDKAGFARVEENDRERIRLKAGVSAYLDQMMPTLMQSVARFTSPTLPMEAAGGTCGIVTLLSAFWWGILGLRSRGTTASAYHGGATDSAFAGTRLIRPCLLILAVLFALTAALTSLSFSSADLFLVSSAGMITGGACSALLVLGFVFWAGAVYRRAFRAAAESAGETVPKPWKGYFVADKRERQRRITGVMGGVMIILAIWGVLVSIYMKTTMNVYPWQMDLATAGMYQQEQKYVRDLVAGKIKVPEKYIKQAQAEQAKRKSEKVNGKQ